MAGTDTNQIAIHWYVIYLHKPMQRPPSTPQWAPQTTVGLGGAYGGLNALRNKQPLALYVFGTAASSCIIVGMFAGVTWWWCMLRIVHLVHSIHTPHHSGLGGCARSNMS